MIQLFTNEEKLEILKDLQSIDSSSLNPVDEEKLKECIRALKYILK